MTDNDPVRSPVDPVVSHSWIQVHPCDPLPIGGVDGCRVAVELASIVGVVCLREHGCQLLMRGGAQMNVGASFDEVMGQLAMSPAFSLATISS